jgi:hypothetical protein
MSTSYKRRETLLKMATALLSWLHWNLILFSGSFLSDVLEVFEECTFVVLNEIKWCRPREKLMNRREIYNWVCWNGMLFFFALVYFLDWQESQLTIEIMKQKWKTIESSLFYGMFSWIFCYFRLSLLFNSYCITMLLLKTQWINNITAYLF